MDQRAPKPAEPSPPVEMTPSGSRRPGMAVWIQIVVSLLVVGAAIAFWLIFMHGPAADVPGAGASAPAAPVSAARSGGGNFAGRGGGREMTVIVGPVTTALINDKLTAIGEGVASRSATLTSATGGILTQILVKPGDRVKAGDPVAQLDAQSQQIAFDKVSLAAKDAGVSLARARELSGASSIPVSQLNAAQLAADNAALELRTAGLALQQRTIVSPIDGVVGLIQVSPGNGLTAQSVITTIEDSSDIVVNFWVPERYAGSLAVGMKLTANAVALPGKTFEGTVSAVDNRIDPASRTLQVEARVPNPDGVLRPGMSFSVVMAFPGETFASVDPLSIQWSSDGAYVWKLADAKVHKAIIQIVQRNSGGVLVTGDVVPGDLIVTQGILQLQDGATVRVLNESATDTGAAATGDPAAAAPDGAATGQGQRKKRGQGSPGQSPAAAPDAGQGG